EARLCAYIDGELSAAERDEIEAHMAANPSHGALLQDLIRHRARLRQLPRESAPRDLMEGFQAQVEREALLGTDELEQASTILRINRWPQILSAAAILLLATGLGVVVYTVLPSHQVPLAYQPPDETQHRAETLGRQAAGQNATETDQNAALSLAKATREER